MDIIVLIFLARQIGNMAKRKGFAPGRWRWMVVLSWISLEILGLLVGMSISGNLILAGLLGLASAFGGYLLVRYRLEQYPDHPGDDLLQHLGR